MIDRLTIGPVPYVVEALADLHYVDNKGRKRELHGAIWHARPTVQVEADQSDEQKVVTLWHDALDGILDHTGVRDQPEALIIALGYGVVQLVRDNPALVALTTGQQAPGHDATPADG